MGTMDSRLCVCGHTRRHHDMTRPQRYKACTVEGCVCGCFSREQPGGTTLQPRTVTRAPVRKSE